MNRRVRDRKVHYQLNVPRCTIGRRGDGMHQRVRDRTAYVITSSVRK